MTSDTAYGRRAGLLERKPVLGGRYLQCPIVYNAVNAGADACASDEAVLAEALKEALEKADRLEAELIKRMESEWPAVVHMGAE